MNKELLALLFVSLLSTVFSSTANASSTYSRTFSCFYPNGIQVEADDYGGCFVSCIVHSEHYFGTMWLMSVDNTGSMQWARPFFQSSNESRDFETGGYILPTADGGCLITGHGEPRATGMNVDVCLVKVDSNGNIQWEKIIGTDNNNVFRVNGIAGSEAGCLLAMQMQDNSFFVMYNQNGAELWRTEILEQGSYVRTLSSTHDGGFIAAGTGEYGRRSWLLKINGNGQFQWLSYPEDAINDQIEHVAQTDDGGYVICGSADDSGAYLVKTDEQGYQLWYYEYGTEFNDRASWVETADNGMLALAGREIVNEESHGTMTLLDETGKIQWKRYYDFTGSDRFESVCLTSSGDFILCGITGLHDKRGIWLLKTDGDGLVTGSENGYASITECTNVFIDPIGWIFSCELANDESSAEAIASNLAEELGTDTGYLWIPNWPSLSGYPAWLVYAGPHWWTSAEEFELIKEKVLELYPDSYLIFAGSEPERDTQSLSN